MTPRLVLSLDFDGTSFEEDGQPPVCGELPPLLQAWHAQGAVWVVNTGRSLNHTLEGLVRGQFGVMPDFIVSRESEIQVRNSVGRWVGFGDWNETGKRDQRRLFRRARKVLKEVRKFVERDTLASLLDIPGESPGIVASNLDEIERVCAFIDPLVAGVPDLRYERNSIYLRFSHAGYTKGSTLAHLASALGLPREAVFAAGDNFNDLTMLDPAVAGHIACPGNSLPAVRHVVEAAGGFCAPGHASTGTAQALRWLALRVRPGG